MNDASTTAAGAIAHGAVLVGGASLLVAASVLFLAVVLTDERIYQVIAGINALIFYLWGFGSVSYAMKTWKQAARAAEARF